MPVTNREEVTKQGLCKILRRTLRLGGSLLLVLFNFNFNLIITQVGGVGVGAYLSLIGRESGWSGRLFEAGRLLTFSGFRMSANSRKALIRGWVPIRVNTVLPVVIFRVESRDNRKYAG